jgi:hypothetical protein
MLKINRYTEAFYDTKYGIPLVPIYFDVWFLEIFKSLKEWKI